MAAQDIIQHTDRVLTYKELLTLYLNIFQDKLIANLIDIAHYERLVKTEPGFASIDQFGQKHTAQDLLKNHQAGARFAKNNIEYVLELLEAESKGSLDKYYSDDSLSRKPLDLSIPPSPKINLK